MPSTYPVVAGNAPEITPTNRVYFPALDGLRAVAFLYVFFHHYGYLPLGWVGVDCFFVLSGFLITGILFDTVDAPNRARNFYVRRTLRIFPLYYGVFLAVLILNLHTHWQWDSRWLLWPAYLANWIGFFHPGALDSATLHVINGQLASRKGGELYLGHFWSLCVEEQFYLVWPWIVFSVRSRRTLLWICGGALLLSPILRTLAITAFPSGWLDAGMLLHSTPARLDTLLWGAGAALLYRGAHRERLLRWARPVAWIAVALALLILRPPQFLLSSPGGTFLETFGFSLIALLSAAVILRCLSPGSKTAKVFSVPPLRWLGRISYGAYIFHDIPHELYVRLAGGHHFRFALIALAGTLLLAGLSYRFYETPFLRLKTKITA